MLFVTHETVARLDPAAVLAWISSSRYAYSHLPYYMRAGYLDALGDLEVLFTEFPVEQVAWYLNLMYWQSYTESAGFYPAQSVAVLELILDMRDK